MGLKYKAVLIPRESNLEQTMKELGFQDRTDILKRYEEWKNENYEKMREYVRNGGKITDWWDDEKDVPEDEELKEIHDRQQDMRVHQAKFYWKELNGDYYMMMFSHIRINFSYIGVVQRFLMDIMPMDLAYVHYHHGSNDGVVITSQNGLMGHKEDEEERFEKYIARAEEEIEYPLAELHNHFDSVFEADWDKIYCMDKKEFLEMVIKEVDELEWEDDYDG